MLKTGSLVTLLLLGLISYQAYAERVSFRPYVIDIPTTPEDNQFLEYISQFSKSYTSTSEFNLRKEIFKRNLRLINMYKSSNYKMGLNFFADFTPGEIFARLKYADHKTQAKSDTEDQPKLEKPLDIPQSVNWVQLGAVSAVKDQGQCGANWAYAAASAIESAYYVMYRDKLTELSAQQLIDCVPQTAGNGCGTVQSIDDVVSYLKLNDMEKESDYQTQAKSGDACNYDKNKRAVKIYQPPLYPTANSQSALMKAIVEGPVLAEINADIPFIFYQSGIIDADDCTTSHIHPVLVVGYGVEGNITYYLVKNSWGQTWGEKGYARIAAKGDGPGVCGIQNRLTFFIADNSDS
ncbi:cathepsin l [Stylonychia lemnae]|uniref:Cathepsin l n=1 Tax=Stylonychia lemnae TaxID=5949 RepID=A0A078AZE6_STYLE|nr:cathepsin l [Stylonychia lemnae]|eukprot:CDW86577.1 cathepsin l [Stylonychia lemnae]